MKIFNTQSQSLKDFSPIENNKIKMYVCGPTVYDYPHLGHARCYITWDTVYKYLKFRGYDVTYARNITDIDDKIINKAKETGFSTQEIADKYYLEFEKAMNALNVAKPDVEPKATENIDEMINLIQILCEKGFAYAVDGDVYFDVSKFNKYGRLSGQNIQDLKSGARVESSEKKKNPADFALWKEVKEENEISWESPWGKGRPGWHLECSAMCKKYLGETIDIHAGGQDLIFPHHENEKAQSEAAFGKDYVRFWMHNGFVKINEEKMSKSLGNYVKISDILEKYDANTIRFFILTNHYRMPVEFNDSSLNSAKSGVKRLKNAYEDIKSEVGEEKINEASKTISLLLDEMVKADQIPFYKIDRMEFLEEKIPAEVASDLIISLKNYVNAMDEDFNTSKALSVLFDIATFVQKNRSAGKYENSAFYVALLLKLSEIMGFNLKTEEKYSEEISVQLIEMLIDVRRIAREQKNWELSDKIRDDLAKIGIIIKDHKDRPTSWSFSD